MSFKNTPFGKPEEFNVVIEIPAGSQNKYEYDEKTDSMKLDFVFQNLVYSFNYGFIPQTKAEDGDTLDAIVLSSFPLDQGTIIKVRPIGVVKITDRGKKDDKIVAVPINDRGYRNIKTIEDLDPNRHEEFKATFQEIARQKKKTMFVTAILGKEEAVRLLKDSVVDKQQVRQYAQEK